LGGNVKEGTSLASTIDTANGDVYVYFVNSKGELVDFYFNGKWTKAVLGGEVSSGSSPTAGSSNQYLYYLNGSREVESFSFEGSWIGPTSL
jgi:hypothetical protein